MEASYQAQLERLRHPLVNIIEGEYVLGNLLEARYRSYLKGTAEYVSWVDDDDEVLDLSWLSTAVDLLQDPKVMAVYPRWRATRNGKPKHETPAEPWSIRLHHQQYGWPVAHHLTIMRRSMVLRVLEELRAGCPIMTKDQDRLLTFTLARFGQLVSVPNMAYEWKLRQGSVRQQPPPPEVTEWARAHRLETLRLVSGAGVTDTDGQVIDQQPK